MTIQSQLIEKLDSLSAVIGVVGLGYVGLPLALSLAEAGFVVHGFDSDPDKCTSLQAGRSYLSSIPDDRLQRLPSGKLTASTQLKEVESVDVIIMCLPTPLGSHREPDLTYLTSSLDEMLPFLRKGQALVLESTTYPGTTEEVFRPRLEARGLEIGEDFFLVYSPEREDPGNPEFTTRTIPKVVGGSTPNCLEVGLAVYRQAITTLVPVSSTRVAEMTKLLENIHRAVNVGLVNELKLVADAMGIDLFEVIDAAATKPFGFVPYYPGPGLGGHCLPIDPFYLTWKAAEYGVNTHFIELAGEVNSMMPAWVVSKIADALNSAGKPLRDSRILLLGVAYKKNVGDTRESPAMEILARLQDKGAQVSYSDPYVPRLPRMRKYDFELESVAISHVHLIEYDAVVLCTDHSDFDYDLILEHSQLIVDTRGRMPRHHHVVRA